MGAGLQEKIKANPHEFYSAYIVMRDESRGMRLAQSLELDLYTRQAGHSIAIKHLKDKARISQSSLVEYLRAQSAMGKVKSFKGHWIDNIISVTARGSLLNEISRRGEGV